MTEYTHNISYSVPAEHIDACNECLMWVRPGPGPFVNRGGGNSMASAFYKEEFVGQLSRPITEANRPEWGASLDLALAQQGQALLSYVVDERKPTTETIAEVAGPNRMTVSMRGVATSTIEDAPEWSDAEDVIVGDLRRYQNVTYMCIQGHTTQQNWVPTAVLGVLWVVIPQDDVWTAGVQYDIDDMVMHEDVWYRCIQAHTSVTGQTPDLVPALWVVSPLTSDWTAGVPYAIDDRVIYETGGVTWWRCIQAHTSQEGWQPPLATLWAEDD